MNRELLQKTAQALVTQGKGILAIDESHGTCAKRFTALGVDCNENTRRHYRGMLVTAPGIEQHVSGMILFDETMRQSTDDGVSYPDFLKSKGMIPGIKLDTGAKDLALHPDEKVTEGLDGLRDRIAEHVALGAGFAKWRSVITIGDNMPSAACIEANAHGLARYAALCQEGGLVPIIEPEILIAGDHSIEQCYNVTTDVYKSLFYQLEEQGVMLEGVILKTSMVIAGLENDSTSTAEEVGAWTVKCLTENVPAELAGVVFLSGGMTEIQSTENLQSINSVEETPWPMTFSYGRAIQGPSLLMWGEDQTGNYDKAQASLVHRANMNAKASMGEYEVGMENL